MRREDIMVEGVSRGGGGDGDEKRVAAGERGVERSLDLGLAFRSVFRWNGWVRIMGSRRAVAASALIGLRADKARSLVQRYH